jgi:hypothetical protein
MWRRVVKVTGTLPIALLIGGSNDLRNVGEVTAATQKTAISMLTSMRTSNLTGSALLPEKYPLSKKRAGQWCLLEIFLDKFALTAS